MFDDELSSREAITLEDLKDDPAGETCFEFLETKDLIFVRDRITGVHHLMHGTQALLELGTPKGLDVMSVGVVEIDIQGQEYNDLKQWIRKAKWNASRRRLMLFNRLHQERRFNGQ